MKTTYSGLIKFSLLIFAYLFLPLSCTAITDSGESRDKSSFHEIKYANKQDWIFFLDFSNSPIGVYRKDTFHKDWPTARWSTGIDEGRIEIVEDTTSPYGRSLRVNYPVGNTGPKYGGAGWSLEFDRPYNELYCSYSVKFSKEFDFVRGGKLPGMKGGKGNVGGHPPNGYDGWSARMMWLAFGDIIQYVYYPDQIRKWGENMPWVKNFWSSYAFIPGKWYNVEHRIKMNTPKEFDGEIEGWLNGQIALRKTGIRFRYTDAFAIDSFYFSTFFGGNGMKWAPVKNEYILFDNFIISTSPITH